MDSLGIGGWVTAIVGALLVGLGKGGLPGAGNLTIVLYASLFGAKASVGILLPVLICADVVAAAIYRKRGNWGAILRLLPFAALGVVVGFFFFDSVDARLMQKVIGGILLLLTVVHFGLAEWKRRQRDSLKEKSPGILFVSGTGILGGFATMVANAAGPIAAIYFLRLRLPKMEFVGSLAWFFLIVNVFKLPFQHAAANLSLPSLELSLFLGVFAGAGAAFAPKIVGRIPQKTFEWLVWSVVIIAALRMLSV